MDFIEAASETSYEYAVGMYEATETPNNEQTIWKSVIEKYFISSISAYFVFFFAIYVSTNRT